MRRSLLCFTATISRLVNLTPCLLNVGHFPISSDLIASQLLLAIAHCIPFSLQSGSLVCVIPSHLNPFHLMSSQFFSPHRISSHLMSSLPFSALLSWSQLFSSLLMSPELFSSLLISSQLISAFSGFRSSSQRFSALSSSCQLVSPHLSSSQRTLISSHLFSGPNLLQKREACTHSKLLHREAWHTEAFTQRQGSFYAQQVFTQSKLLHRASFYTEQAFTQKPLHREAFKRCKLWSTF